jgi:hypothetical protein
MIHFFLWKNWWTNPNPPNNMILTRRLVFWSTWFTLNSVCLDSMSLLNGANRSGSFFFDWLGFCVKELIWFTLNSVCLDSLSLLNGANRSIRIFFFLIGWRRKFWVFALDLNTFEFRVCWDFYVLKNCGCKEWRIEFLWLLLKDC